MSSLFHKLAVIDIGSNSIRLAIFDREKRGYLPIFNEKGLCGLGKNLAKKKKLDDQAKICTFLHIKRFLKIIEHMEVDVVKAVATAAMREAEDGQDFANKIEEELGLKIEIISAEMEGYYAALGVRSGLHQGEGFVADLGGASLELIDMKGEENHFIASLLVGGITLQDHDAEGDNLSDYIEGEFLKIQSHLTLKSKTENLFLVGGGFRTVGKAFLDQSSYEPKSIHHFLMKKSEVVSFCKKLISYAKKGYGQEDLEKLYPSVSGKRAALLPYYAYALLTLTLKLSPRKIIFSAYGLKEGVFYESLSPAEQQEDPLLVSARLLGHRHSRFFEIPPYTEWTKDLFNRIPNEYHRLFKACSKLTDLAWMDDYKVRGHVAFWRIAHMQLPGVTHQERMIMALVMYCRYGGDPKHKEIKKFIKPLSKEDKLYAQIYGLALRLGAALSVGDAALLAEATLKVGQEGHSISLVVENDQENKFDLLYGELVQKRLRQLKEVFIL